MQIFITDTEIAGLGDTKGLRDGGRGGCRQGKGEGGRERLGGVPEYGGASREGDGGRIRESRAMAVHKERGRMMQKGRGDGEVGNHSEKHPQSTQKK